MGISGNEEITMFLERLKDLLDDVDEQLSHIKQGSSIQAPIRSIITEIDDFLAEADG